MSRCQCCGHDRDDHFGGTGACIATPCRCEGFEQSLVVPPEPTLEERIRAALNYTSAENASDTPDFILARYLIACLDAFNAATIERAQWYGPGRSTASVPKETDR